MIINYTKTFIDKLNSISYSRNHYEIFNDFIYMAAAALYSWKKDEQAEKEYLSIAKNYSADELEKMAELLYIITEAFEKIYFRKETVDDNYGDFMGHVFMELNYGNKNTGQYFTPYQISYLIAEMSIGEKELSQGRLCKISDPCCGAGGMLIASAMIMKERGYNYQQDALFIGQDIDRRCACMTFIQLSLLGVPALVICGDTLAMKTYWQRETIGYHLNDMDFRLRAEKILEYMRNIENPEQVPEPMKPLEIKTELKSVPQRKLTQGELF
jgi:type I restriction-modification system DNA methylase subunit